MAQSRGKGNDSRSKGSSRGTPAGGSSRGGAQRGGAAAATASRASGRSQAKDLTVPDPEFDLISVVYHALQGAETVEMYLEDADEGAAEDEQELREYFQEVADVNRRLAARGRSLLARMIGAGGGDEEE